MKVTGDKLVDNALPLALGAAVVIAVAYFILRKAVGDVAKGAAGLLTGDNAITQNATNADGEKVDAYESRGVLGTLGASANAVSGGLFASWGQYLADKAFSAFHPSSDRDMLTYLLIFPDGAKHAVNGTDVDDAGYFKYKDGKRYRIVVNQANQNVAVAA